MDPHKLIRWFAENYNVSEITRDETTRFPANGAGFASEYALYKQPDAIKLTISTEKFSQLMGQLYQLNYETRAREYNPAVADAYNKYQLLLELCK